jgi:hypothetical protein
LGLMPCRQPVGRMLAKRRKNRRVVAVSTLETIVEELKALPPPKLEEAADYIHHLRETTRDERLAALERTAGVWSGPDGEAIERAIEEGCGKIDPRDW